MDLNASLTEIKGIGPKRAETLARLGLFSLRDLLCFAPREHCDLREAKAISALEHGEMAAVRITEIEPVKTAYPVINGRRTNVVNVTVGDGTGRLRCTWYNQPYARRSVPDFAHGYVYGRIDKSRGTVMVNGTFCDCPPGILPIYSLTRGIGQGGMRSCMRAAIKSVDSFEDVLPDELRMKHGLCTLRDAMCGLHFPAHPDDLAAAKRRLAFDDALSFTILLESLRKKQLETKGIAFDTEGCIEAFLPLLPFAPTEGQLAIMREIAADMASPSPMNRLIQGDVGSGKTVLAIFAMFVAIRNEKQAALMAPTELLALQHFEQLKRYFGGDAVCLTGSMKKSEQNAALSALANGSAKVAVGTHALIEGKVEFKDLGIVITDEQHRFGVRQRAIFGGKSSECDSIIMSATPIPRTLSLILYGDLDVSRLTEMPKGRRSVITRYVPPAKRLDMYRYIEREIKERGIQAFVVCPMIEDNDEVTFACSAESVYAELCTLLGVRIELIHGRMKPAKRDEIMERFRKGEIDLIVSTTVIEVGVDVPNACIMAVESADRFGLAQLHQLRGRVGRSDKQSYCFLLSESSAQTAADRIRVLVESDDGFKIAEQDLISRGPGELLGQRQSGISDIAGALMLADMDTLTAAKDEALLMLADKSKQSRDYVRFVLTRYKKLLEDIAVN